MEYLVFFAEKHRCEVLEITLLFLRTSRLALDKNALRLTYATLCHRLPVITKNQGVVF